MKTVQMSRDFVYRPHHKFCVKFHGGMTYRRVLEAAARQIERAGAGRILSPASEDAAGPPSDVTDAYHAWQRRW